MINQQEIKELIRREYPVDTLDPVGQVLLKRCRENNLDYPLVEAMLNEKEVKEVKEMEERVENSAAMHARVNMLMQDAKTLFRKAADMEKRLADLTETVERNSVLNVVNNA